MPLAQLPFVTVAAAAQAPDVPVDAKAVLKTIGRGNASPNL